MQSRNWGKAPANSPFPQKGGGHYSDTNKEWYIFMKKRRKEKESTKRGKKSNVCF